MFHRVLGVSLLQSENKWKTWNIINVVYLNFQKFFREFIWNVVDNQLIAEKVRCIMFFLVFNSKTQISNRTKHRIAFNIPNYNLKLSHKSRIHVYVLSFIFQETYGRLVFRSPRRGLLVNIIYLKENTYKQIKNHKTHMKKLKWKALRWVLDSRKKRSRLAFLFRKCLNFALGKAPKPASNNKHIKVNKNTNKKINQKKKANTPQKIGNSK